jgi:hypothetical protein
MQTINDRLLAAVFDFCDACESLLVLRRSDCRCTEFSRGDYTTGDPGSDACDWRMKDGDDLCEACQSRKDSYPAFKAAIAKRNAAKRRMLRLAKAAH